MPLLRRCVVFMIGASILVPVVAAAQKPWTVKLATTNPLPIGGCAAVWLAITDPATRDDRWVVQETAKIPVKSFHVLDKAGELQVEPFYVVMGIAPSHYGVAMMVRASQRNVVNLAQQGGMCAVMVSAKALHTAMYRAQKSNKS